MLYNKIMKFRKKEDTGVTKTAVVVHLPGVGRDSAGGTSVEELRELALNVVEALDEQQRASLIAAMQERGITV